MAHRLSVQECSVTALQILDEEAAIACDDASMVPADSSVFLKDGIQVAIRLSSQDEAVFVDLKNRTGLRASERD